MCIIIIIINKLKSKFARQYDFNKLIHLSCNRKMMMMMMAFRYILSSLNTPEMKTVQTNVYINITNI